MHTRLTFDTSEKFQQLVQMHRRHIALQPLTTVADDLESTLIRQQNLIQELQTNPLDEDHIRQQTRAILTAQHQIERFLTRPLLFNRLTQLSASSPTDFQALINRHRPIFTAMLPPEITFTTAIAPAMEKLAIPESTIMHVLVCLCINAREAMDENGILSIIADVIKAPAKSDTARIRVTDTGCGMTEEQQSRLFTPFATSKHPESHQGLSLFICQQILQDAGATLTCKSAQKNNTVFELTIPIHKRCQTETTLITKTESTPQSNTILVVEDEKALRRLMAKQIRNMGFDVLEADNGRDALERIAAENATVLLVVTDIMMPEMGGIELVDELRSKHPSLPVIFVSGYIDETFSLKKAPGDRSCYLRKPFPLGTLSKKIREFLPPQSP